MRTPPVRLSEYLPWVFALVLLVGPVLWCLGDAELRPSAGPATQPSEAAPAGRFEGVCFARYDQKLGFTVPGKVAKVRVKPGDKVEAGQVLLELECAEVKLALELAKLKADSLLEVQGKEQELSLAQLEERRLASLLQQNAAAPIELERAQIRARIAQIALDFMKQSHKQAQLEADGMQARYDQYLCRAPRAGTIEVVTVEEGELVEALKPAVRLVAIDPIYVEVWIPTAQTIALQSGDPAWVEMPGLQAGQTLPGRIAYLAQTSDPIGKRLVRLEVPNPDHLPPGGKVTATFRAPAAGKETRP